MRERDDLALLFAHKGFHGYTAGPAADERLATRAPQLANFLGEAWKIDKSYTRRIVRPVLLLAFVIGTVVDQMGFDGVVNGCGAVARKAANGLRVMVDGSVKNYALWMSAGAAALALMWIWS